MRKANVASSTCGIAVLGIVLSGCGLKGPLYLPDRATPTEAQQATDTTSEEEAAKRKRGNAPTTPSIPEVTP